MPTSSLRTRRYLIRAGNYSVTGGSAANAELADLGEAARRVTRLSSSAGFGDPS